MESSSSPSRPRRCLTSRLMPPSRSRGASHFLVEAAPADFTSVERWFCSRIGGNIPRPRRFYTGGAMVEDLDVSRRFLMCSLFPLTGRIWFLREEQSSLHRPEVGGGAGTRKGVTGAESRRHRRKVGGGPEFLSLQETEIGTRSRLPSCLGLKCPPKDGRSECARCPGCCWRHRWAARPSPGTASLPRISADRPPPE